MHVKSIIFQTSTYSSCLSASSVGRKLRRSLVISQDASNDNCVAFDLTQLKKKYVKRLTNRRFVFNDFQYQVHGKEDLHFFYILMQLINLMQYNLQP